MLALLAVVTPPPGCRGGTFCRLVPQYRFPCKEIINADFRRDHAAANHTKCHPLYTPRACKYSIRQSGRDCHVWICKSNSRTSDDTVDISKALRALPVHYGDAAIIGLPEDAVVTQTTVSRTTDTASQKIWAKDHSTNGVLKDNDKTVSPSVPGGETMRCATSNYPEPGEQIADFREADKKGEKRDEEQKEINTKRRTWLGRMPVQGTFRHQFR